MIYKEVTIRQLNAIAAEGIEHDVVCYTRGTDIYTYFLVRVHAKYCGLCKGTGEVPYIGGARNEMMYCRDCNGAGFVSSSETFDTGVKAIVGIARLLKITESLIDVAPFESCDMCGYCGHYKGHEDDCTWLVAKQALDEMKSAALLDE